MKRILYFIAITMAFLTSCEKEPQENMATEKPLTGYKELLQAYDDGKLFREVQASAEVSIVVFEDGSKVSVPISSFAIHDHSETPAPVIDFLAGSPWWRIDGQMTGISVDPSSMPKEDAKPVYVYFDSKSFYMHISNREVLVFGSRAQNEAEELERQQNIPTIYIDTDGKGIYDKENYVKGTITIKDPEKLYWDNEEFMTSMGIRGRGNSTWSFPKKPWKVKLDSKASIFGMGADKEWCLLANYSDRTLMRNILAMKLSEICGFAWTPHMYSVHVYLNDDYQGVYTFCEHKKVSEDRVDIDVDAGDVYLEIEEQQDETTCWWTSMGVPMMFSDPEEPSSELLAEVKKHFSDFENSLYSTNLTDPQKGYAAYVDVDSFIDYYIVQEIAKNTDGNLRKSSFITRKKGGKLVMHHLWDFDLTFGNSGWLSDPEGFYIRDYKSNCTPGDNWFNRMLKDPAFAKRLKNRWNELYPQLQTIPEFIDRQAQILDKAQQRNFQVWDINTDVVDWVGFPSLGSYDAEVAFLKDFYSKRVEWLNKEINKL